MENVILRKRMWSIVFGKLSFVHIICFYDLVPGIPIWSVTECTHNTRFLFLFLLKKTWLVFEFKRTKNAFTKNKIALEPRNEIVEIRNKIPVRFDEIICWKFSICILLTLGKQFTWPQTFYIFSSKAFFMLIKCLFCG